MFFFRIFDFFQPKCGIIKWMSYSQLNLRNIKLPLGFDLLPFEITMVGSCLLRLLNTRFSFYQLNAIKSKPVKSLIISFFSSFRVAWVDAGWVSQTVASPTVWKCVFVCIKCKSSFFISSDGAPFRHWCSWLLKCFRSFWHSFVRLS